LRGEPLTFADAPDTKSGMLHILFSFNSFRIRGAR
jgi:hypothetical protein